MAGDRGNNLPEVDAEQNNKASSATTTRISGGTACVCVGRMRLEAVSELLGLDCRLLAVCALSLSLSLSLRARMCTRT